ncbi:MAG TPA: DUF3536 domain-containing protein, partial [Candidatus Bathyarchaeia archaeon]|nr:DUF3536 domain-containing protein [Candidatus Bathyarchaeia archaeon]
RIRTLSLLEMQRNAMLMYTSCGWFFDEVSGIETIQIMQYAAKAIQSAKTMMGMDLLPEFLERLKAVPSNVDKYGNAAVVFKTFVQPATVDMERVAAHYAMTSLFEDYRKDLRVYCFPIHADSYEIFKKDDERMAIGRIKVFSEITTEQGEFSFVVLYFGGHDLYAGISGTLSERDFFKLKNQLSRSFLGVRNRSALRILRRGFEYGPFSLKHLFRDEQARILYQMLDTSLFEVERSLREIHDHHYPIMQVIKQLRMPLPKVLANTILVMVNTDFLNVLSSDSIDFKRLSDLVDEVKEWDLDVDRVTLEFFVSRRMKTLMEQFQARPKQQKSLRTMNMMLKALEPLRLHFDVGKCQNIYFSLFKEQYPEFKKKGEAGQAFSKNWAEMFEELGVRLNMVIISKLGVK